MKREIMITAGAAAILAVGLAGCSSNKSVSTPNGGGAAAGASQTKLLIDGQEQSGQGKGGHATTPGNVNNPSGGGGPQRPTGGTPLVRGFERGQRARAT